MPMSKIATTHKLVWGWIRLALGIAQVSFAVMGVTSLLIVGTKWPTSLFVICAFITTTISWLLYRGKSDPYLTRSNENE